MRVDAARHGSTIRLRDGEGESRTWETRRLGPAEFRVRESTSDGRHHTVFAVRSGRNWWVHLDGRTYHLKQIAARGTERTAGELTSPIPGTVTEIPVSNGDTVEAGQVVMVISAMKMQLEITAPHAGVVRGLGLAVGDPVDGGRELLMIEAFDG